MHEIAEYLSGRPPFAGLDAAELEQLAATVEIEFFAAGTMVFQQGAPAPDHTRVIRTGAIDLLDDGRVLDRLGEASCRPSVDAVGPADGIRRAGGRGHAGLPATERGDGRGAGGPGRNPRFMARSLGERARLGATHGTRFGDELSAGPVAPPGPRTRR